MSESTATTSRVNRVPESCLIDTAVGGSCCCDWAAVGGVFGVAGGVGLSFSNWVKILYLGTI
ncbi:hypothetical protein KF728_16835 [Candidatus Obscuribacterales bacterium]|nr:hypothetical protein [Candidatus Obscuribacterales bacterium]